MLHRAALEGGRGVGGSYRPARASPDAARRDAAGRDVDAAVGATSTCRRRPLRDASSGAPCDESAPGRPGGATHLTCCAASALRRTDRVRQDRGGAGDRRGAGDVRPVEIVSVDSALVYRGMDIGTAKPSAAERAQVPHHLIDIIDPTRGLFGGAASSPTRERLIAEIDARGRAAAAGRRHDAVLQGAVRRPRRDARRPTRACAPSSTPQAARDGLAGAACRARARRLRRPRRAWRPATRSASSARSRCGTSAAGRCRRSTRASCQRRGDAAADRARAARPRVAARAHRASASTRCSTPGCVDEVRALRARGDLHAGAAVDALRRLPPGLGGARQRPRPCAAARARHRRDAPARQAPAHLAARHAAAPRSMPATRRRDRRRSSARPAPSRKAAGMMLLDVARPRQALRRRRTVFAARRPDVAAGEFVARARRIGRRQVDAAELHRRPRHARRRLASASTAPTSATLGDDGRSALLRRSHLGFVFQAFHVLPHLSGGAERRRCRCCCSARARRARASTRCSTRSASPGSARGCRSTLSGGQLQRVAIARALVHRPR